MKKWICGVAALLLLVAGVVIADSGRETLRNPPQEIEMLSEYSSSETWAFRVKDSSEVVRYQIDSDGTLNVKNSSGTKVWGINAYGNNEKNMGYAVSTPTFTSGTGFDIDEAAGNIFLIDRAIDSNAKAESDDCAVGPAGSGITVLLSAPTAATDGDVYTFIMTDSGSTTAQFYATGGIPIVNASGTTDGCAVDAQGDSIQLMADYNSAVSYWLINHHNN